jgi:sporulation protein YlmC with PRC-barrel domain
VENRKFSTDIIGKSVVTTTGQLIGKLDNLVANLESGEVTNLLVEPAEGSIIQAIERDGSGRYVISLKRIRSTEDVVVVDLSAVSSKKP